MLLNMDIVETNSVEARNENHSKNSTSNSGYRQRIISHGVVKDVALSAPRIPPIDAAAHHTSNKMLPLPENGKE